MECETPLIDARTHLARAVADLHERVDRAMTLEQMSTPADYRSHLRCHARVLIPLEKSLQASRHAAAIPDMEQRWRSSALEDDLRAMGETEPEHVETRLGASLAAFAGAMYVLEGSRLGAKMLLRQLGERSGEALPAAFLSHGTEGRFWPSFVNWLNSLEWSQEDLAQMRESARSVFQAYLTACEDGA